MNIQSFLEHHGILRNPFAEEDAQTDPVFKDHCIVSAYHPVWDKIYGDPGEPATAIIFGPKGSGKTAMRLQIDRHLGAYNREHPTKRVFVIRYDDFNPFLDHFQERSSWGSSTKPEKVLDAWRLWDHMDAVLCIGVTDLIDRVLEGDNHDEAESLQNDPARIHQQDLDRLDRTTARDLLLLACCYDQSTSSTFTGRWNVFRSKLHYRNWWVWWDLSLGLAWMLLSCLATISLVRGDKIQFKTGFWLLLIATLAGFAPYLYRWLRCFRKSWGIRRRMRIGKRELGSLRKVLMRFPIKELDSQPLPRFARTDDRFELLTKFQMAIKKLGFSGVIVLIDRVDEPHLTGGKPELMRRLVWPLLDNKLLKHPGLGIKMMLPQELHRAVDRESTEFHERARLDKQNMIPAFAWTGESLYDLARVRMLACGMEDRVAEPKDLFCDQIGYARLLVVFQQLRVPRHLFRFLYRVMVEHCNKYSDAQPEFKVDQQTFESVLAVYLREIET